MVTETDAYTPAFDEPAISIRELRGLLQEIADAGDFRVVLKIRTFLTHLIDGHDPVAAWELSGLGRKFGPFEAADLEPIKLFRGVPGRKLHS